MPGMQATAGAEETSIHAVVLRCGCGSPATLHPSGPCPTPRASEDLGTVAYWHRNPLRRWLWRSRRLVANAGTHAREQ